MGIVFIVILFLIFFLLLFIVYGVSFVIVTAIFGIIAKIKANAVSDGLDKSNDGPLQSFRVKTFAALILCAVLIVFIVVGTYFSWRPDAASRDFRAWLEAYHANEPVPLSHFFGAEYNEAYVLFVGAYEPVDSNGCSAFDRNFYESLGLEAHSDEGIYDLVLHDETSLITKIRVYRSLVEYPDIGGCVKLKDVWIFSLPDSTRTRFEMRLTPTSNDAY